MQIYSSTSSFGVQNAIIQMKHIPKIQYFKVAWLIDFIFKILIALCALVVLVAVSLLSAKHLEIISSIFLTSIFSSFEGYTLVYLTKHLKFAKRFILEVSRSISFLIGVLILYHWVEFTLVEALIISYPLSYAVRSLSSYFLLFHVPVMGRLEIKTFVTKYRRVIRFLFVRGLKTTFANYTKVFLENIDKLLMSLINPVNFALLSYIAKIPSVGKTLTLSVALRVLLPILQTNADLRRNISFVSSASMVILLIPGVLLSIMLSHYAQVTYDFLFDASIILDKFVVFVVSLEVVIRAVLLQQTILLRSRHSLTTELRFSVGLIFCLGILFFGMILKFTALDTIYGSLIIAELLFLIVVLYCIHVNKQDTHFRFALTVPISLIIFLIYMLI